MTDSLIPRLFNKHFFPLYILHSAERVHQMFLNGKGVRIWKEVVVAYLKVLCLEKVINKLQKKKTYLGRWQPA
jgi:hypothetical protein